VSDQESGGHYSHALHYAWLTSIYDPVVRLTCREAKFKKELVQQVGASPGESVLDLGCGTATLSILLKKAFPEAEIVGLDGSDQILEIAKEKVKGAGAQITFLHALSYEIPVEDNHFDRVVSSFFFHHLNRYDKKRTLDEVYRVLRPAGELHVADWGKPPNTLFRLAFGIVQLLDGFETTRDSVEGILPVYMEKTGLEGVKATGRVLTPLGSVSLYKAAKPGERA